MSKKRISSARGEPRRQARAQLRRHVFLGVALSGGKADKTCLSAIEYYPHQRKIFVSHIIDNIKTEGDISSDLILYEEIKSREKVTDLVAYNVPLTLPKCMTCKLRCPGVENCKEEEILWMWDFHRKVMNEKSERKLFTPYTERCVEQYLSVGLEEPFHLQHALGANLAPLTARAHFLNRRLKMPTIEVFPRISLWRIGRALHIQKSYLRHHKHQIGGVEAREAILHELIRREIAFIYEQDVRLMTENSNAFDAFLCGLTAVLKFTDQCEKPLRGFPKSEGWIEIPKETIVW